MCRVRSHRLTSKHMYNKKKLQMFLADLNEIKKDLHNYYITRKLCKEFASLEIYCNIKSLDSIFSKLTLE